MNTCAKRVHQSRSSTAVLLAIGLIGLLGMFSGFLGARPAAGVAVFPAAGEPAPIPVGQAPKSVAIAPDGQYAYVANVNDHTLSKIRTADNTVVATIGVGYFPKGVAVRADSAQVAVASATQGVSVVSAADNAVVTYNKVGETGSFWWLSSYSPKAVSYRGADVLMVGTNSFDIFSFEPANTENVGGSSDFGFLGGCDFTPAGSSGLDYVVSSENTNQVVYTQGWTTTATQIAVGTHPCGVAVDPTAKFAYVANQGSNNLSRINLATKTVTHTIPVGASPSAIAFSPDGAFAYVTNQGAATVSRVRTATNAVDATFPVGTVPSDIAVSPDGSFAYVTNWSDNTVTRLSLTPGAPTITSAAPGNAQATITFNAPAPNGSDAITNYQYSTNNGTTWTTPTPAATTSPLTITGLANGTTYQVKLRAINSAGPGAASTAVPVTPIEPGPVGNVFVPITPSRVVDTRTDKGGTGAIQTGTQRVFSIATVQDGGTTAVPPGATAIVYNLTVPNPATGGHLRVMPGDAASLTTASAINFRPGETIANGLTTTVDGQRRIAIYAGSTADAIVDVVGFYLPSEQANNPQVGGQVTPAATGTRFTPTEPQRVYSTIADPAGALPAGANREVSVAAAVPVGATAVAYNITVVRPASNGHLRVMPGDVMTTPTSAINWTAMGDTIANGLTVALSADRTIRVQNYTSGEVPFLFDVVGYYSASGALFYPTDPTRVFESRTSHGGTGPILPLLPGQRVVSVARAVVGGAEQVPEGSIAIAYNVAVTNTGSSGHLRVYPGDLATLASASTLNWRGAGFTRANGTAVGISALREVKVYNGSTTPTDVFIDTYGYFR